MSAVNQVDTIVVGAGISGLVCAHELAKAGLQCLVLEASDQVGGRIATDQCEGFLLDRGFQVFLTAYPEASRVLDYAALELGRFEPGALIRHKGKFHRFSDPWRRPQHFWSTATAPIGSLFDKLRIARFRSNSSRGSIEDLYARPEQTTLELLQSQGFTAEITDRFFRPFLGGVFLDHDLSTSSRMCEFVFRMFSQGEVTLPANGMRALPRQLAEQLPTDSLRTDCPVDSLKPGSVILKTGEQIDAQQIVLATDATTASRLLGQQDGKPGRQTLCIYFAADQPPLEEPILVLNGDGHGPINSLCVPSQVVAGYAPAGQSLISVSVGNRYDPGSVVEQVREQLLEWYGPKVEGWRHLRTYEIEYALPDQTPPALDPVVKSPLVSKGLYRCGDYCDTASINGAMAAGRRAAEMILSELGQ